MRTLTVVLLTFLFFPLYAQVNSEFKAADVIALHAPDSCETSVAALGRYFSSAFKKPAFRARAIYAWTAMKISYDFTNQGKVNAATPFDELVEKTMQSRSAICQGYASVFKSLCDECGIKAYVVNGYTRQNGHLNDISHAWVIALIDTTFYGFDPTWASGALNNGSYIRQFNEQFFMIRPSDLISDHMPFDPMWECLHYPVSSVYFSNGITTATPGTQFFSYADSISLYQSLAPKDQCQAALRRIEASGIVNNMQVDWAKYLRDCISNEKQNTVAVVRNKYVKQFNDAVANYNNCIYAFNQYADYFNVGFNPPKSEPEIVGMLNLCYNYLDTCRKSLNQVIAGDPDMKQSTDQLQLAIDVAQDNVDKQKVFLKVYFNTDPMSRPMLFRKYNGAGLPKSK